MWNRKQLILNTIKNKFKYFIKASPTNLPASTTALN